MSSIIYLSNLKKDKTTIQILTKHKYNSNNIIENKNLDGAMGSRRGSATPTSRSRQGSITIGGLERRGSYYDDDVTKR